MLPTQKIICGDYLTELKKLPDDSVDLVLTSPPYDNLREYKGYSFDFEATAQQIIRVLKQGGVVVWIVGDMTIDGSESCTSFKQALYFKKSLKLHDTMIYWKNAFPFPESNRYAQCFEYMFVFSKGKPKTANIIRVPTMPQNRIKNKSSCYRSSDGETKKMKYETGRSERNKENIWVYDVGYMKTTKNKDAFKHPAMFPEALARDHISSWSNKGDLVLDPFCGSGTTCVMAEMLGRNWLGIDISDEYCELARKRIKNKSKNPGFKLQ